MTDTVWLAYQSLQQPIHSLITAGWPLDATAVTSHITTASFTKCDGVTTARRWRSLLTPFCQSERSQSLEAFRSFTFQLLTINFSFC
ncbi:hypothetical protein [Nostoc sp. FACHB-888]|uniref:hypothetical protein n=1 Tax=Nostoc sp. FACHB-888 TaxID=2692842 RepID=UPI001688C140|nr:hypothetical protein [Nostoc sp. FACHB-888]MBD2242530.1 hypothetical protein [Nostoc sp. FACHB-888]